MFDPRLLRAFVAIADTGSFTHAAERLHQAQSTISQQLGGWKKRSVTTSFDRAAPTTSPIGPWQG